MEIRNCWRDWCRSRATPTLSIQQYSKMPWNLARPLPLNLMPWCCFIALRIVCAHPALQGSFEGHDLAPAIHSSHEHFLAPYNDHHGFKHGEFVNHKRLRENQQVPHQSEFLNADTQSPDLRDNLGTRNSLAHLINPHSTFYAFYQLNLLILF